MKNIKLGAVLLTATVVLAGCGYNDTEATTSTYMSETEETTVTVEDIDTHSDPSGTETTVAVEDIDMHTYPNGTWNKTECHSCCNATVEITNADDEGFDFSGQFCTFAKYGEMEGRAVYISDTTAVWPPLDDDPDPVSTPSGYIYFEFDDQGLHITTEGNIDVGPGPSHSGYFIQGDPHYINDEYIAETFSEDELSVMSEILTQEQYEDEFTVDINRTQMITSDIELEDGRTGRLIHGFAPGAALGVGFDMLITDDGIIYYLNITGTFATNDGSYEGTELPGYSNI